MYSYIAQRNRLPVCDPLPGAITPDYELLKTLLYIQTPSGTKAQQEFLEWVEGWIEVNEINCTVARDSYGNMYITKGKSELYPCVVAHVDINQEWKEDFEIIHTDRFIFGFDNTTGEQCGLGADDKVGVYFALEMLSRIDHIKVFLPLDEEIGLIGTYKANMDWFRDLSLCIQLDRRSYTNDITDYTNGVEVVSGEFKKGMKKLLKKYDYSFAHGVCTDIGGLKIQGMDCVAFNVSCGYINEHMDNEIIMLNHFHNAINFGYEIITSLGDRKWYHVSEKPAYRASSFSGAPSRPQLAWEEEAPREVQVPVWHHTEEYKFTNEDEDYIQDCLETGECPICSSNNLIVLSDMEEHCLSCQSTFNIPEYKTLLEVEMELNQPELDY